MQRRQAAGVTNCLNFGNPYDPEVYYQFVHAIKGMGEACRKFDTPVTGGNVSFYNQNPDGPVFPTPTIGMVGLLEDINNKMTLNFKEEAMLFMFWRNATNDMACSQYLSQIQKINHSAPHFNLDDEFALQEKTAELIAKKLVRSVQDVSEGCLFLFVKVVLQMNLVSQYQPIMPSEKMPFWRRAKPDNCYRKY
jgi:phosphoribosylformylglycinamidine synthase